jgi:hypothetical protein
LPIFEPEFPSDRFEQDIDDHAVDVADHDGKGEQAKGAISLRHCAASIVPFRPD